MLASYARPNMRLLRIDLDSCGAVVIGHALAVPFSLLVICILLDGSNQWNEEDVTFAKLTLRTARLASEAWNRWTDTDANAPENALKEVLEFAEHCDLPEDWGEGAYCTGCTVVEQR